MGKIDGILSDLLKELQPKSILDNIIIGIIDLITRMTENNLIHMDLHFGNIGYQINIETRIIHFVLLDFESAYFGGNSAYELRQLREACRSIENNENQTYICNQLYGIPFCPTGPFPYIQRIQRIQDFLNKNNLFLMKKKIQKKKKSIIYEIHFALGKNVGG